MKLILSILLGFTCISLSVEPIPINLTTIEGDTYKNVRIIKKEPCKIQIMHNGGIAKIRKGSLPDDFIKEHQITYELCDSFESDRAVAHLDKKVNAYINSKSKIELPDGRVTNSSKIINYNPVKIIVISDDGVRGYEINKLSKQIQDILDYSLESANEYNEFLKIEAIQQKKYLARVRELELKSKREAKESEELARIKARAKKARRISSTSSSSNNYSSSRSGQIWVRGYTRRDGTRVSGHWRSR